MKENSHPIITDEQLVNKIYLIRGQKVMLDRDLAVLYDVKAIRLREQVKRNISRFPVNFMFQLTEKEIEYMVSQIAIPSKKYLGGTAPYVFTEHGILQLSNVLRSGRAEQMSIQIINVFIRMREMLLSNKDLLLKVEAMEKRLTGQDEKVKVIFEYLKRFIREQEIPLRKIGFKRKNEK